MVLTYSTIKVLANVLLQKDKVKEAQLLLQQALTPDPHILSPDGIQLISLLEGLMIVYTKLGHYNNAKHIGQEALFLCTKNFGTLHPDTLGVTCIHL